MRHLTDDETRAVPASTSTNPHVQQTLAACDAHVAHLDEVLADNERVIAPLRDGTSWSAPETATVAA